MVYLCCCCCSQRNVRPFKLYRFSPVGSELGDLPSPVPVVPFFTLALFPSFIPLSHYLFHAKSLRPPFPSRIVGTSGVIFTL